MKFAVFTTISIKSSLFVQSILQPINTLSQPQTTRQMSTPLVDSLWGGEVVVGPKIKYAGIIEAAPVIRGLLPAERMAQFDALVNYALGNQSNTPSGCCVIVFEDWSMRAINTCNYNILCWMIENQDGNNSVAPVSGDAESSTTNTTDGNTDAALP